MSHSPVALLQMKDKVPAMATIDTIHKKNRPDAPDLDWVRVAGYTSGFMIQKILEEAIDKYYGGEVEESKVDISFSNEQIQDILEVIEAEEGEDEAETSTQDLERLAEEGQLMAYRHDGFWQCVDTLRDLRLLKRVWDEDKAAWKLWMD